MFEIIMFVDKINLKNTCVKVRLQTKLCSFILRQCFEIYYFCIRNLLEQN